MVLVESYPCKSKYELESRERYWIETLPCVNLTIPTRTRAEYYKQNKEEISAYNRKLYYDNVDVIKERHRQYYRENRDLIISKQNERVVCECGMDTTRCNITHHRKSKKHISLMTK
jgi:hypothetical protein